MVEGDHHKWLLKLMTYNFDIQYKQGIENKAVDTCYEHKKLCP